MIIDINRVVEGYARCALFAEVRFDGNPLEEMYTIDDIEESSMNGMEDDCYEFVRGHHADLELYLGQRFDAEDIGSDLWYTRNGHGTGFWDRGLGEVGERLTKVCRSLPERYLGPKDSGRGLVME